MGAGKIEHFKLLVLFKINQRYLQQQTLQLCTLIKALEPKTHGTHPWLKNLDLLLTAERENIHQEVSVRGCQKESTIGFGFCLGSFAEGLKQWTWLQISCCQEVRQFYDLDISITGRPDLSKDKTTNEQHSLILAEKKGWGTGGRRFVWYFGGCA